jgi:hypothetical protein
MASMIVVRAHGSGTRATGRAAAINSNEQSSACAKTPDRISRTSSRRC